MQRPIDYAAIMFFWLDRPGERKCSSASQTSLTTGSETVGKAPRAKTARFSFPPAGTYRPLHRRLRFVPIPLDCRSRWWPARNAERCQIGSSSRRVPAITRFQDSSILEFGHRWKSRRRDGKHYQCLETPTRLAFGQPPSPQGPTRGRAKKLMLQPHPKHHHRRVGAVAGDVGVEPVAAQRALDPEVAAHLVDQIA